jgi:hypothetical protein
MPMWGLIGAVLGAAAATPTFRASKESARLAAFILIICMNSIYIGAGLTSPTAVLLAETAVAVLVCGLGYGLFRSRSAWLGVAILVHAAVDGGHHVLGAAAVPAWYLDFCLGFDLAFAALLTLRLRRRDAEG